METTSIGTPSPIIRVAAVGQEALRRRAIKREAKDRDKDHQHDVAWAGSMHGPYSADGETFAAMLKELGDEDPIAYGVMVVFEDGCWLSQRGG